MSTPVDPNPEKKHRTEPALDGPPPVPAVSTSSSPCRASQLRSGPLMRLVP
jgi:hypothetical protein